MKMFLKYISFFILFVNGYGQIYAHKNLPAHNNTTSFESTFSSVDDTLLYAQPKAFIAEKTDSQHKARFSESEETEVEEAQNESDLPEFLTGNGLANLFFSYLTLCHPSFQTREIGSYSSQNYHSSYRSLCVRFCVFRI